ncbi:MAG: hypothetical protein JWR82_206, partial [Blastococcus sp.]|nr:hypothetical protein [Blastococcus sp.]
MTVLAEHEAGNGWSCGEGRARRGVRRGAVSPGVTPWTAYAPAPRWRSAAVSGGVGQRSNGSGGASSNAHAGSGSGSRHEPGGQEMRETPLGVRTISRPSVSSSKCHPRAKVLIRWCRRQRQQRFQQSVGPPSAWAMPWSMSQRPGARRQPGMRHVRSRTRTKRACAALGRYEPVGGGRLNPVPGSGSVAGPRAPVRVVASLPLRRRRRRRPVARRSSLRVPTAISRPVSGWLTATCTPPPGGAARTPSMSSSSSSSRHCAAVTISPATSVAGCRP